MSLVSDSSLKQFWSQVSDKRLFLSEKFLQGLDDEGRYVMYAYFATLYKNTFI